MEFKQIKLREFITIKYGKDHKKLGDGDIPVFGSGGLMRYADKYLYDGESVLLPRKGTLSNIQYYNGKFWTVDTLFYSIVDKSICLPKYLYYLLHYSDISGFDSGASIPSMTVKTYKSMKVKIPPIPFQEKAVLVLSKYDELISKNNEQIDC